MSQQAPPLRPSNIIDLISDDEAVVSPSKVVDLTLLDESGSSGTISLESNKDVEDRTPSLTSGCSQKEGLIISPKTQPPSDDNSTDYELTLSNILARGRKRKHGSDKTAIPKQGPDSSSLALTKEAVASFLGSRSLKPNTSFWTIYKSASPKPAPCRSQPSQNHRDQDGKKADKLHDNPHILNVDRDEILGSKLKKRHINKAPAQKSNLGEQVPAKDDLELLSKPRSHTSTKLATVSKTKNNIHSQHAQPGTVGSASHARRSTINSQEKPPSSALDDEAPIISPVAGRRRPWEPLPATQPDATQDRLRPLSSAPVRPSVGHRKRPWERPRPSPLTSHQQRSGRPRAYSPVNRLQSRQGSVVEETENEREKSRRPRQHALLKSSNHNSGKPDRASKQQRLQKEAQVLGHRAIPQQPDSLFDSDTSSQGLAGTNDAQRAPAGYGSTRPRSRGLAGVGGSLVQQPSGGQTRQQQPLPRPPPQRKPSTINLSTTNAPRRESSQTLVSRGETFEDAAAAFNLLESQHAKRRTTAILDSVPAGLGMPSRASRARAAAKAADLGPRARNSAREARKKRARYREKAIADKRRKLEQAYAHEPAPYREARVNEGLDACRRKYAESDRKRRAEGEGHGFLTVDFLEDGAVADDDDDDDENADEVNFKDGGGGAREPAPQGLIPASQAMEPGELIVVYAVYLSEPFEEGGDYEDHMQRIAEAFLKKDEANAFAHRLLTDMNPSSRQPLQEYPAVYYKTDGNGLLEGHKRLSDGKFVYCMVRKEKQLFGQLHLSGKWVREEVKDLYRPRYDIFYTNVIPKVFFDKDEEDKERKKEEKAREAAVQAEQARIAKEVGLQEEEKKRKESPEQWVWKGLDDEEEEDSSRLFSPTPTLESEATQKANGEIPLQGGDDNRDGNDEDGSDTASVASDATLQPSHPGGALGQLSWRDVEYQTVHVASYTDLRLANEAVFQVARVMWKPRTPRHYAWEHYQYAVVSSLEEDRENWDMDAERAEIEFEVPDVDGLVEHRPWLFVHSRLYVVESKLEGPRDIGCDFVVVNEEDG